MALQLFDRVLVTATANTTVSFTLGSAVAGYQSFSVMTNGDTTYYGASDGTNWEVGLGTYTSSGPTLTRTTILSSSNSGSAVTFSGTPNVWIDYPAGKSVYEDASNNVTLPGTLASTGITTPSVTATTTDLTLSAISTGVVNVNTLAGKAFSVTDHPFTAGGANVNFTRAFGGQVGYSTGLVANGSDSNVTFVFSSKGTSGIEFWTANLTERQLVVSRTASAVNYVQVTGGATGNSPVISAQGSDAAVALSITSKSTNAIRFLSNNAANLQFRIVGTNTAVNNLAVTGTIATNAPSLSSEGSDTNISMAFQPKGTGAIDLAAGSSGVNISNGGTVTAVTRSNGGANYTSNPTIAISAPTTAGGVQAVLAIDCGPNLPTIASGGTGYTVGDVLTFVGGTFTTAYRMNVTSVSGGVITGISPNTFGSYTVFPASPVSVTGGTGSGATFTATNYSINLPTITNAGSGYIEQPTITFSGGGGSGAAAYATVGGTTIVRGLGTNIDFYVPSSISSASPALRIADGGSSTIYPQINNFGSTVNILAAGVANTTLLLGSNGTNPVTLSTNGTSRTEQLRVSHTASAVNYVQVTGSATGGSVIISAQGSDGNVGLQLRSRGTGDINLMTAGGNNQAVVRNTGNGTNFLGLRGGNSGVAPSISSDGGDTNIDLALTPKGTGRVKFGTYTGTILTPTGFVEIVDSGGTVRRLLVG